jgi:hypothetical protein
MSAWWRLFSFLLRFVCKSLFYFFFLSQGRDCINWLLRKIAENGDLDGKLVTIFYCTPYSLTTLEYCVQHRNAWGYSNQNSSPPQKSIPLNPLSSSPVAEACDKVLRTTSCPGLLCPDKLWHTSLTMDMGIWSSSKSPKSFSVILVIFQ